MDYMSYINYEEKKNMASNQNMMIDFFNTSGSRMTFSIVY